MFVITALCLFTVMILQACCVRAWLVGRPPGFMYGVGPLQRGFAPPPPRWNPQCQFVGNPVVPASRPMSGAPRPGPDSAVTQHPPVAEHSTGAQPRMQFVPTQVITQPFVASE